MGVLSPRDGAIAWVEDEQIAVVWNGGEWAQLVDTQAPTFEKVGINAVADTANRLSINSSFSLFNHEGDDHQLKINKNTTPDNASLLFQSGFQGAQKSGFPVMTIFTLKPALMAPIGKKRWLSMPPARR